MKSTSILPLLLIVLSCNSVTKDRPVSAATYEEAKVSVQDVEKQNPKNFLDVNCKVWINLASETVIEGDISSSATLVTFKDVVLLVKFYTKTDTYLDSRQFTIYEFVAPGKSAHFKLKMRKSEKVSVSIDGATAI